MKTIILLLLVSLSLSYSHAQSDVRDSLNQLLQKEKSDTSRVLLLVRLGGQYSQSKPDSAMLLALQGLELSRRIGFAKGEAASLNGIGNAYGPSGNYPKQMQVYLQALAIREKINDVIGIAGTLNNIGNIYRLQGEYRQATEYHLKGKKLSEQLFTGRCVVRIAT
ncbi:MAG: histidine kinase [Segetibacter sp.]|nr:histidine kinase [Segetibacter sp.]